jgi:hypothetical protein
LGTRGDGFDVHVLFAVPVLDRADTDSAADAKYVIAVAERKKRVVGIPITGREFELRLALAIGIDGLLLIEIDAVRHEFGLNGYTVMVKRMVCVVLADIIRHRIFPLGDRIAMTDFLAFGEDCIAGADTIRLRADLPKRCRYPRLARRE